MDVFQLSPSSFINWLNSLPPELIWVFSLIFCFGTIIVMLRLFGAAGLYVYIAIAVVAANIQVLKVVQFSIYDSPLALGTILFTSTYLCTDILAEYYGPKAARRGVYLGFAAMLLMTLFMILTLGFAPLDPSQVGPSLLWATHNHEHMLALFTPAPALFLAGMTAYLLSQLNDVWVFNLIKRLTGARFLWLRNNVSTCVAVFIDNVIFSVLAWIVLAENPIPWTTVWSTYILGTYGLRVIIAFLDTPFIYAAKYVLPKKSTQNRVDFCN